MSKVHDGTHNGIRYTIYEYDTFAHWDVVNKKNQHVQRQESNYAKANQAVKKYIDQHKSELKP